MNKGAAMFNAEKLLGTILREVTGSGSHDSHRGKKKHKHGNALVNSLKTGSGLMTAIGLGVGAYEILRGKQQAAPSAAQPAAMPPIPPVPVGSAAPGPQTAPPPLPSAASRPPATIPTQELARRMIQVMIAAAHADGTMDEEEERAVLDRLKGADLSQEERMFLVTEMHNPKSIAELTAGIAEPSTAKGMYMLAVGAVAIDSETERRWFDELAAALGLSKAVQAFIEEQH